MGFSRSSHFSPTSPPPSRVARRQAYTRPDQTISSHFSHFSHFSHSSHFSHFSHFSPSSHFSRFSHFSYFSPFPLLSVPTFLISLRVAFPAMRATACVSLVSHERRSLRAAPPEEPGCPSILGLPGGSL